MHDRVRAPWPQPIDGESGRPGGWMGSVFSVFAAVVPCCSLHTTTTLFLPDSAPARRHVIPHRHRFTPLATHTRPLSARTAVEAPRAPPARPSASPLWLARFLCASCGPARARARATKIDAISCDWRRTCSQLAAPYKPNTASCRKSDRCWLPLHSVHNALPPTAFHFDPPPAQPATVNGWSRRSLKLSTSHLHRLAAMAIRPLLAPAQSATA